MKKLISCIAAAAIIAAPAAAFAGEGDVEILSSSSMSIVIEADGGSHQTDISALSADDAVSGYEITTADSAGNLVRQEYVTKSGNTVTVDMNGAAKAEISPVFSYENVSGLVSGQTLISGIATGSYNFTFKSGSDKHYRYDMYINGGMVGNNIDQIGYKNHSGSNDSISVNAEININDIVISDGTISVQTMDFSNSDKNKVDSMSYIKFYKSPSIISRKTKVFVLGDSLVARYYGSRSGGNMAQYGWGEVLNNFFTNDVEVVNLANAGYYATSLETTAFTGVTKNGQSGDYFIIESGYNDLKHNTAEETQAAVERMVNAAKTNGMIPIVVSPNASMQTDEYADDYVRSVRHTAAMKAAAESTGALYIDLSGESYKFYREHYGDDRSKIIAQYNFSNDSLHHNWYGAMNCARIVAQGMYDAGIGFINTDYSFTFTDTASNVITLTVSTSKEPEPSGTPAPTPESGTFMAPEADITVDMLARTTAEDGSVADSWYCTLDLNDATVESVNISVPAADTTGKTNKTISSTQMSGDGSVSFGIIISYLTEERANELNYTPEITINQTPITALDYAKTLLKAVGSALLNEKSSVNENSIIPFEIN